MVLQHFVAAGAVERDVHLRTALPGGGGRVDELVAGDDDVALEHAPADNRPRRAVVDLGADGRAAARRHRPRIDQPVFERRHLAEDVLHLGRVLHAGQLHDDAIETLPLHDGLGHAERVHAVAQRGDVGGDGEVAALAHLLLRSSRNRPRRRRPTLASRHSRSGCAFLSAARTAARSAPAGSSTRRPLGMSESTVQRVDVGERDLLGRAARGGNPARRC